MLKKVTDSIIYVGANDHEVDLFEGQYVVPNGMSYNSYVILDEKVAVMDTIDQKKTAEWLKNIDEALAGRQPDYLVVQHMEPDHAASIEAFVNQYPAVTVVGNAKTFPMIAAFFPNLKMEKTLTVQNLSTLELGSHTLTFAFAPMVHWPEVMMSYESSEKVLFSADGFGKFGALDVQGALGRRGPPVLYRHRGQVRQAGSEYPQGGRHPGHCHHLPPPRSRPHREPGLLHQALRSLVQLHPRGAGDCPLLHLGLRPYRRGGEEAGRGPEKAGRAPGRGLRSGPVRHGCRRVRRLPL